MNDRQETMMYEIEEEVNYELERTPTFLERAQGLEDLTVSFIEESVLGVHEMSREELQKLMWLVMRTGDYSSSDDVYKRMHEIDKLIWTEVESRKRTEVEQE